MGPGDCDGFVAASNGDAMVFNSAAGRKPKISEVAKPKISEVTTIRWNQATIVS
jgi:hypothetical protein